MSKSLVLVESPAKCKTINKYLGDKFIVESTMGHLVDLPASEMGVDTENGFKPRYVVIAKKKKILTQIKKYAKETKEVYLACDPDREGEAIAWHLANQMPRGKKMYRVEFHEITKEAIEKAFKSPRTIDLNLVNAQQARRILDRIVGYSLSPILWRKVSRGLSAGRVQSVAVRLVVDREREIKNFIPQEYWDIEAELRKRLDLPADENKSFKAKLDKYLGKKIEIKDKTHAEKIVGELNKETFIVGDIKEADKRKRATAPFTTSKLQQDSFNKLHFPVNKTMKIAQELYEGLEIGEEGNVGLITYMRTDSVNISKGSQEEAKKYIIDKFGKKYYPKTPNAYKAKKSAQEAHEAIRPALPLREPDSIKQYLNENQYKLYRLIWEKFISSQMEDALYSVKTVEIKAGNYIFRAVGTTLLFDGFMAVYQPAEDKEQEKERIPVLTAGEELDVLGILPGQHFTKPPPRYSDASLVKALEEDGIGRPSTYAPIIQTIIMRNYVSRIKGYLHPSELGFMVTDLLIEHFPRIMDIGFTAEMEEELDQIEDGKIDWIKVLNDFYGPFKDSLDNAVENMKNVKKMAIPTNEVCELCGKPMIIKWGRHGKFLSCSGFPECKHARAITTGVKCPREGCQGQLIERRSRRGSFYGCTKYPECKYISRKLPDESQEKEVES